MKNKYFFTGALSAALFSLTLSSCADTTEHTAGAGSTFYDGTITGIEAVTFKGNKNGEHTFLGMVVGGLLGNLANGHHGGTIAGAAIGGLVGKYAGSMLPGDDGLRLTIDSDMGNLMVDVPFSCKFTNGGKVRIVTHADTYELLAEENGRFVTPENESYSKCPAYAEEIKSGKYLSKAEPKSEY